MATKRREEIRLRKQVKQLQGALAEAQRGNLLTDPITSGVRNEVLPRYIRALTDLVVARGAPGRSAEPSKSTTIGSERRPDRVPAWADDLFKKEIRVLGRRADWIEDWLERPHAIRRGPGRRCLSCGNGLAKGAKFCPGCGQEAKPDKIA